ncbi:MAG TPA: alpha/beta hydrolase [Vicinamibacterales bacterium]|nr:alpha/beta hydrolase [Vicinamibacterales bacterium]
MNIIDKGSGVPVVLVPGIQGRWEWMKPAVDALSTRCRVITFSLADEPTSGASFDERSGFDSYVRQIGDALDAAGVQSAIVCGISYGGLIAATFAARHPERTRAVVVVSAIPPSWKPDPRVRFLMRAPRLLSPLFCINSLRLFPEMVAAKDNLRSAVSFALRHLATVVRYGFSPRLMAWRARALDGNDLEAEVTQVCVPALVVAGQAELDRVVPVALTRDYLRLWPEARFASMARSGHLGSITRPDEFAELITRFAEGLSHTHDERRRVVV